VFWKAVIAKTAIAQRRAELELRADALSVVGFTSTSINMMPIAIPAIQRMMDGTTMSQRRP
jgi:hypothetical protein